MMLPTCGGKGIRQGVAKADTMGVVVDVKWVPAHKSEVDVEHGVISDFGRVGNDWADRGAKRGAQLHLLGGQPVKIYHAELAGCG